MLEFWQHEIGLPFEEALPTGGGTMQHRHGLNGGVLKINHSREPLPPEPPAGYHELLVARPDIVAPRELADPDGNRVTLVPPGHEGITATAIRIATRSLDASRRYYRDALQMEELAPGTLRLGETLILLHPDPSAPASASMRGPGYRYLTVQVWDCDAECAGIAARGGTLAMAPRTMGAVARFGFVRDPDGNSLEVSQRASLTGPLPTD